MKKHLSRLLAALLAMALLTAPACALTVPQALELLEENYYYGIPDAAYEARTLDELIQILGDPYTDYMSAEEYALFLELVEDTVDMVGVGVEILYTEDGILIKDVLSGGSAQEAGLRGGDLIVAVDGAPCVPAGEEDRLLLLGEEGTKVTLTVLRDGQARDYGLTRRAVYIPNTQISLLEGGVGYVDCNSFGLDTDELLAQGLEQYDAQVDFWVLDLRGNAGGYVDSALEVTAALNGPGRSLYFEEADGQVAGYACRSAALTQKPLILLLDGESASASELVASSIRDTDRGVLVGGRTYGKGVAQSALDESSEPDYFDGDCLKVTTARFYAAGGTTTDRIGVIPTLLVDEGYAEAVAAALTGGSEDTSQLCVIPGSQPFYVDPDADDDVLAQLLEALPPQTPVFFRSQGVFGQCTPAQAAQRLGLDFDSRWFSDVADSRYDFAIDAMGTYRLLSGTEPGLFSPRERLTRAQLCVMMARVLNAADGGPSRFGDVAQDAWYASGVNAMAALGLVDGVGDGRFDPEGTLTQEEFLTIMGRTARYLSFALDGYGRAVEDAGDDLPPDMAADLAPYSDWARSGAAVLAWGLEDAMGGSGDLLYASLARIDPAAPILREEAAAGMYALLAGLDILP